MERRERYPGIAWSEVIGMRNRLIHGYDVVDLDIVWQTVAERLPGLVEALEEILTADPG